MQPQAGLGKGPVALARVATTTGGNHVLPVVGAPAAPRHDVVDALRPRAAVLAAMLVAVEDRPPTETPTPITGDVHVTRQANHGGLVDLEKL